MPGVYSGVPYSGDCWLVSESLKPVSTNSGSPEFLRALLPFKVGWLLMELRGKERVWALGWVLLEPSFPHSDLVRGT